MANSVCSSIHTDTHTCQQCDTCYVSMMSSHVNIQIISPTAHNRKYENCFNLNPLFLITPTNHHLSKYDEPILFWCWPNSPRLLPNIKTTLNRPRMLIMIGIFRLNSYDHTPPPPPARTTCEWITTNSERGADVALMVQHQYSIGAMYPAFWDSTFLFTPQTNLKDLTAHFEVNTGSMTPALTCLFSEAVLIPH